MGRERSAPTLDDVAREAGVSTATVSRCLNTPERVVEKTRERVQQTIERLGYTPNFAARVMAANRTFTIGAIIPTMENAIFARGLQAFQDELREWGYTLLVSSSAYKPDLEKEQIQSLVARGADGLLLIGHERDDSVYEYIERQKIPALVAWSYAPEARLPSVGFDNRAAIAALAQKVIDAGHKTIAVISGRTLGNDRAAQRIEGVRDALRANGMQDDQLPVVETEYAVDKGALAFRELRKTAKNATAVMCGNDVLAAGALREAQSMGLSVPNDISITGFDDIELAEIVSPALTTVHVPHREMGRKAAAELVAMVTGKSAGKSECISTKIIERDSLGPFTPEKP